MKPTTEVTKSGVTSPGHSDAMGHSSCDKYVCRQVSQNMGEPAVKALGHEVIVGDMRELRAIIAQRPQER
jgi:hypothetical protein